MSAYVARHTKFSVWVYLGPVTVCPCVCVSLCPCLLYRRELTPNHSVPCFSKHTFGGVRRRVEPLTDGPGPAAYGHPSATVTGAPLLQPSAVSPSAPAAVIRAQTLAQGYSFPRSDKAKDLMKVCVCV